MIAEVENAELSHRLLGQVKRDYAKGAGCQRQVQHRHRDDLSTILLLFTAKNEIIINSKAEPIQSVYI